MNLYFDKISFSYPNKILLNSVSLRLNTSELVCLLGRNGSGKTTLMQIISGRLTTTSGEIRSSESNDPITNISSLKHHFAILPQGIQDPPYLKVREILNLAQFNPKDRFPWKIVKETKAVADAIASCELETFVDRSFDKLSGGEKQRVWLAFCLIQNKSFMILDESLHALDFSAKEQAFQLLATLAQEGAGILLSTHDLALAEKYADRIIYLKDGHIAYNGSSGDTLRIALS